MQPSCSHILAAPPLQHPSRIETMPPNPNRRNSRNEAHDVFMQFHRHRAQSIKALDLKMSES